MHGRRTAISALLLLVCNSSSYHQNTSSLNEKLIVVTYILINKLICNREEVYSLCNHRPISTHSSLTMTLTTTTIVLIGRSEPTSSGQSPLYSSDSWFASNRHSGSSTLEAGSAATPSTTLHPPRTPSSLHLIFGNPNHSPQRTAH